MVLNSAARMVVGFSKYEHITPVLRDILHWLPVTARIQFKIDALTFDCVRPVYLKQAIRPVSESSRQSLSAACDKAQQNSKCPRQCFLVTDVQGANVMSRRQLLMLVHVHPTLPAH